MRWSLFLSVLLLVACQQAPIATDTIEPLPDSKYRELMRKNTKGTNQYSGFYQTFQADLTILTNEVLTELTKKKAHFLKWDQHQYQQERQKALQEANAFSRFFMRFYTPNPDHDDLHKGKTIWRVYLDLSGSRFEGKVQKMTEKLIEIQTLFPHMDRFSTPYEITFNVPMMTVERGGAKVILTSSLGEAEFVFPLEP